MSHLSFIEPLEDRIAPAGLITSFRSNSIKYTDVDGDLVTVSFSKSFISSGNINNIFTLQAGGSGAILESINLTASTLGSLTVLHKLAGMNISITAKKAPGGTGDGLVNVGLIDAENLSLGSVKVGGDIEAISAGSASKNAVSSLTLDNFGAPVLSSLGEAAPNASLSSNFNGNIARMTISGNIDGESFNVSGGIGTATIKGNVEAYNGNGGNFFLGGGITSMTIKGNMQGGSSQDSGEINAVGGIGKLTIGGNLDGTTGTSGDSGDIITLGAIKTMTVGGNILGGPAGYTGAILAGGAIGTLTVTGSVEGTTGPFSGSIIAHDTIGTLTVGGLGTDAAPGAVIGGGSQIKTMLVKGSIIGTAASPVIISAEGLQTLKADVAIGSFTVDGNMTYGALLAGYYQSDLGAGTTTPSNPTAQIGAVVVKGNFTASDLLAGVENDGSDSTNGTPFAFGDTENVAISNPSGPSTIEASIASIVIGGTAAGDSNMSAAYEIVANTIGSLKLGGVTESLSSLPLSLGTNLTVNEVPA